MLSGTARFNLICVQRLNQLLFSRMTGKETVEITVFLIFSFLLTAHCGFIPGRGCGTITPITILEDIADHVIGQTCVLVKDREGFAQLKQEEPSFQFEPWSDCSVSCAGGTMTRQRRCLDGFGRERLPEDCGSLLTSFTLECNAAPCPGIMVFAIRSWQGKCEMNVS